MPENTKHTLGTVEASEQLIRELYLDLRARIRQWAALTKQTAQARMGYIGQHLVSVATGFPGGKSGARGRDLILPDGAYGEIKTCYRVDQLGRCLTCGAGIAPMEMECPQCGGTDLRRLDDSKWLIGIRNDEEFEKLTDPALYYLVLFEFTDIERPDTISATIWTVDPKAPGFILCMIDYYLTIRAKSKSKAPFNLWPHSFKFELMRPMLIYKSIIKPDNSIETEVFPGRDEPRPHGLKELAEHARSTALSVEVARDVCNRLGIPAPGTSATKRAVLQLIEERRRRDAVGYERVCDVFAQSLYLPRIDPLKGTLSPKTKAFVR